MRLVLDRYQLQIVPSDSNEDNRDIVYIEELLGLRRHGDTVQCTRVNAHDLSSCAYLRIRKQQTESFIYLASPFTHADKIVEHDRYNQAVDTSAYLIESGLSIFSPIVYTYHIYKQHNLPGDISFWHKINESFLTACSELYVLCIPGTKESKGVKHEVEFAIRFPKKITYINTDGSILQKQPRGLEFFC